MSEQSRDGIEAMLSRYRPAGPGPELRDRVLALRAGKGGDGGLFWWAMAASLLIGAALAQIGASATRFVDRQRPDLRQTRELAVEIREALPEVSEQEAAAMSLRLAAADAIIALPSPPRQMSTLERGVLPWDMDYSGSKH